MSEPSPDELVDLDLGPDPFNLLSTEDRDQLAQDLHELALQRRLSAGRARNWPLA